LEKNGAISDTGNKLKNYCFLPVMNGLFAGDITVVKTFLVLN
jgi:hypothetical protein